MKRAISIIALALVGVGAIAPLTYKVVESRVLNDVAQTIEFEKDKIDVFPGQSLYLNPISKNIFGKICDKQTYLYSSSDESLMTVDSTGKVLVSKDAKDSAKATIKVESGKASSEVEVEVVDGIYQIIDVSVDQDSFSSMGIGKAYQLDFDSLSSTVSQSTLKIEVLDQNKKPIDGILEVISWKPLSIKAVGCSSGYIRFSSTKSFNDGISVKEVPFTTSFVCDCLSNTFQGETLTKSDIEKIKEIAVTNGDELNLDELNGFSSLEVVALKQEHVVALTGEVPSFDITVSAGLFDQYETNTDRAIANRIYPDSSSNALVVYTNNEDSPLWPYKVFYKNGDEESLLRPEEYDTDGYSLAGLYKDSSYENRVYGFNDISKRARIHALYDEKTYRIYYHSNYAEDSVISVETVSYNEMLSNLPTLDNREDFVFKGWMNAEGVKRENNTKYRIPSDLHLYAIWQDTFKIIFNSNGGDYIAPISVKYNKSVGSLPSCSKTRSKFVDWFHNDIAYSSDTVFTFEDDITLTALWIGNYSSAEEMNKYAADDKYETSEVRLVNSSAAQTLTIPSYCRNLKIIGDGSTVIGNIVAAESYDDLTITLSSVVLKGDSSTHATLDLSNRIGNVTLKIEEDSALYSKQYSGTISQSPNWTALSFGSKDLTIEGEGKLSCFGQYTAGADCYFLTSAVSLKPLVHGSAGINIKAPVHFFSGYSFRMMPSANGTDGKDGSGNGEDGSNGNVGKTGLFGVVSSPTVSCNSLSIDTSELVKFEGMYSSQGGNGGNGGRGGNGHSGYNGSDGSWWTDGGNGGPGGSGGRGGDGGQGGMGADAQPVVITETLNVSEQANFHVFEGVPGAGGLGGNGGKGGDKGVGGNGGSKGLFSSAGSKGPDGSSGAGGTGGSGGYAGNFYKIFGSITTTNVNASIHVHRPVVSGSWTSGYNGASGNSSSSTAETALTSYTWGSMTVYGSTGYEKWVIIE